MFWCFPSFYSRSIAIFQFLKVLSAIYISFENLFVLSNRIFYVFSCNRIASAALLTFFFSAVTFRLHIFAFSSFAFCYYVFFDAKDTFHFCDPHVFKRSSNFTIRFALYRKRFLFHKRQPNECSKAGCRVHFQNEFRYLLTRFPNYTRDFAQISPNNTKHKLVIQRFPERGWIQLCTCSSNSPNQYNC